MQLEIVTHCWKYSRLLTYQLSSLVLHPPAEISVRVTVFYCHEDTRTEEVLNYFSEMSVPRIEWNWRALRRRELMRRAIGRNYAARETTADWIWFTDCDMCFGSTALDGLGTVLSAIENPLVYPGRVRVTRDHALGDEQILRAGPPPRIVDIAPEEFVQQRFPRAIGPAQVVRGDVAREYGYCEGTRWQRPADRWQRCHEDVAFRKAMHRATNHLWQPVHVRNVFRIRHSQAGRNQPDVEL